MAERTLVLGDGDEERRVRIAGDAASVDDGAPMTVERVDDDQLRVGRDPARTAWTAASGQTRWVFVDGEVYRFEVASAGPRVRARTPHGSLSAPMPATVVRIHVAPGAAVTRGQTLVVLEAMKMELPVHAPANGTVRAVNCKEGDLVRPGQSLIEMDERDGAAGPL